MPTNKKLGQLLIEKQLISEAQLDEALREQQRTNEVLGAIAVDKGWITPEQLLQVLSEQYQMPWLRLGGTRIDRTVMACVPLKVALHYKAMPIRLQDRVLTVAIANPQDVQALDELGSALQQRYTINPVLTLEEDILRAVRQSYGIGAETIQSILTNGAGQAPAMEVREDAVEDIEQLAEDASVVKLVNQLIVEAHKRRASDIHLEPYRGKVRLRYRIDGMLHNMDVPPGIRQLFPAIVSRVKVLSNLNLVERRLPQDGRASVKVGKEKLDLRVAVLPTPAGEGVVIRILPNQMLYELKELGFRQEDLMVLEQTIRKPAGMILVTGPTGSGKTTSLYACLKRINSDDQKIITIEDPIEYELEGVSQVQVIPQIGLTFAQGLRSMLRHDPDVMMVGEIRDVETAELAIRIALTGHIVFSTLHTNDATSAVVRLLDMGIDPYLIASSIECVIGQRLVRRLCAHCKKTVAAKWAKAKHSYEAQGCQRCNQTGFLGRVVIYEFFLMSQEMRNLIVEKAAPDVIRRKAIELGMQVMREDGWDKVKSGMTALDEVLRVTQDES